MFFLKPMQSRFLLNKQYKIKLGNLEIVECLQGSSVCIDMLLPLLVLFDVSVSVIEFTSSPLSSISVVL